MNRLSSATDFSVVVVEGPNEGQRLALDSTGCRIGSAADADLRMAGEEPLALLVRRRPEGLVVYNRGEATIRLGRKPLEPGESAPWPQSKSVRLSSGAALRCVDTASSVAERPTEANDSSASSEVTAPDGPTEGGSRVEESVVGRLRLAFALLAAYAIVSVMDSGRGSDDATARETHATVEALVETAPSTNYRLQEVRSSIQRGRIAELRRDPSEAVRHYTTARTLLRPGNAETPTASISDLHERIEEFLDDRLNELDADV